MNANELQEKKVSDGLTAHLLGLLDRQRQHERDALETQRAIQEQEKKIACDLAGNHKHGSGAWKALYPAGEDCCNKCGLTVSY